MRYLMNQTRARRAYRRVVRRMVRRGVPYDIAKKVAPVSILIKRRAGGKDFFSRFVSRLYKILETKST